VTRVLTLDAHRRTISEAPEPDLFSVIEMVAEHAAAIGVRGGR
jgi:hypothetical protein